jgi:hypothetical protein
MLEDSTLIATILVSHCGSPCVLVVQCIAVSIDFLLTMFEEGGGNGFVWLTFATSNTHTYLACQDAAGVLDSECLLYLK